MLQRVHPIVDIITTIQDIKLNTISDITKDLSDVIEDLNINLSFSGKKITPPDEYSGTLYNGDILIINIEDDESTSNTNEGEHNGLYYIKTENNNKYLIPYSDNTYNYYSNFMKMHRLFDELIDDNAGLPKYAENYTIYPEL